ncbi:MAG: hypothetical protein RL208_13, partial [Pseudomonadota bacterium]
MVNEFCTDSDLILTVDSDDNFVSYEKKIL